MYRYTSNFPFLVFSCENDGDCNGKGTCINSRCNCNVGWDTKSDCSGIFNFILIKTFWSLIDFQTGMHEGEVCEWII